METVTEKSASNLRAPNPHGSGSLPQFERGRVIRFLLFIFVAAALVGLFSLGDVSSLVSISAGQRSPRTLISSIDFDFEDKAATQVERDRAAASVPPVWRIQREGFNNSWRRITRLMERLRNNVADATERWNESSRYALSNDEAVALARLSSNAHLTSVGKILEKTNAAGIIADRSEVEAMLVGENSQIILEPGEWRVNVSALRSPSEAMQVFEKQLLTSVPEARNAYAGWRQLAADALQPNLVFDRAETNNRKNARRASIPAISRRIVRGQAILYQGQVVTEQAVELLRVYSAEMERLRPPEARRIELYGQGMMILVVLLATCGYLWSNHPETLRSIRQLLLLITVALINLGLVKLMMIFCRDTQLLSFAIAQYAIPTAVAPVLVGVLLQPALGVFVAVFVSVFTALMAGNNFALLITGLVSGFVGVYFSQQMRRRSRLIRAGLAIAVAELLCIGSMAAMTHTSFEVLMKQVFAGLINGGVTVFLVSGFLPICEHVFQLTTDMRLLELSDLNHPLLKRLCLTAPGTYHHSLVVANLAEAAAEAIGANSVLTRVCAYYHDIGKTSQPQFFAENQTPGVNPHDRLDPAESYQIIANHVAEGEEMARKHHLSQPIIDVIKQHQGTTLVYAIYHKANQMASEAADIVRPFSANTPPASTVLKPREEDFRYPGPKPSFRESAIISLADAVESASRSLRDPTPENLRTLVDEIISRRFQDNQLDECDLTIHEVRQIGDSFVRTLQNMLHTRVAYPKDERRPKTSSQPEQSSTPSASQPSRIA